jgi:hypothetical protein
MPRRGRADAAEWGPWTSPPPATASPSALRLPDKFWLDSAAVAKYGIAASRQAAMRAKTRFREAVRIGNCCEDIHISFGGSLLYGHLGVWHTDAFA